MWLAIISVGMLAALILISSHGYRKAKEKQSERIALAFVMQVVIAALLAFAVGEVASRWAI